MAVKRRAGGAGCGTTVMTEIDWGMVRVDYEAGEETLVQLEQKYGTTKFQINKHKEDEGWLPRCRTVATRRAILSRVYRILDGQTRKMEAAMDRGEEVYGMSDLANVTRTLEKLIALNKAEERRKHNPPESAVMKALRDKLADRIEQLNQG
jgi:primosomal protein N'